MPNYTIGILGLGVLVLPLQNITQLRLQYHCY